MIHFALRLTLDWTFFGLTPNYKVQKQEQIFDLIFHTKGAFTYNEVYHMPVYLRVFYLKRLNKYFKEKNKADKDAMNKSKAASRPKFKRR